MQGFPFVSLVLIVLDHQEVMFCYNSYCSICEELANVKSKFDEFLYFLQVLE